MKQDFVTNFELGELLKANGITIYVLIRDDAKMLSFISSPIMRAFNRIKILKRKIRYDFSEYTKTGKGKYLNSFLNAHEKLVSQKQLVDELV